jgi:hypothetical protein
LPKCRWPSYPFNHRETLAEVPLTVLSLVAPLDDVVAQAQKWNVRNLGWLPDFLDQGKVSASISQRAANKTAEVVVFVNEEYLTP